MHRWRVHYDADQLRPWRAYDPLDREPTERGFSTQWDAYAYAFINAAPGLALAA